jgi:transcriptional regulator with XRE-family HTH domain/Zn-dependent peptidase ImmA (M78 family)
MPDVTWRTIGQRVREARVAARLSQEQLGGAVGLDRTMVAKIEAGNRQIDAVELSRLCAALGVPLDHFFQDRPAVLSRRGELAEDDASSAGREAYQLEVQLTAWLRDVRQLRALELLPVQPPLEYPDRVRSAQHARTAAGWTRQRLGLGDQPLQSLLEVCERAGLLLAVVDAPGDGASLVEDGMAVGVVSGSGDPGRRRATAAHELGHAMVGDEYSSDLGVSASRDARESTIDAFAAEFLLPAAVIAATSDFDRGALVRLSAVYRTSWSLAVKQAVRAGALPRADKAGWLRLKPTKAELMEAVGWAPQPDLERVCVPPGVAHAVLVALQAGAVTAARAVELMRGQVEEGDLPVVGEDASP